MGPEYLIKVLEYLIEVLEYVIKVLENHNQGPGELNQGPGVLGSRTRRTTFSEQNGLLHLNFFEKQKMKCRGQVSTPCTAF